MGATIHCDEDDRLLLKISGTLSMEELISAQQKSLKTLDSGVVKLLVIVAKDFRGWLESEAWDDMSFFSEHGDKIEKIAIVGESRWESRMLMFAGAGLRRAQVKYFAENGLAAAYDWLAEMTQGD